MPATEPGSTTGAPPPALRRGVVPAGAALVPGLVLHGAGHYVAGDSRTARRLLVAESVGVGALVGGVLGLAFSGASRHTVELFALTTMAGAGLFLTSWLADVYGILAPAGGFGRPLARLPWLSFSAGVRFVNDPTLSSRLYLTPALDLRLARWRLSPAAFIAPGGETLRVAFDTAFRVLGPRADRPDARGTSVDLVLGLFHHRHREASTRVFDPAYDLSSLDLRVESRVALAALAPSLAGAFVDASAGLGIGAYQYPQVDAAEAQGVLIGGFGFGAFLGHHPSRRGTLRLFYEHRHDGFAGGLKTPGLGSGALGHFGAELVAFLSPRFGLVADVQAGAAWVFGLAVVHRMGELQ